MTKSRHDSTLTSLGVEQHKGAVLRRSQQVNRFPIPWDDDHAGYEQRVQFEGLRFPLQAHNEIHLELVGGGHVSGLEEDCSVSLGVGRSVTTQCRVLEHPTTHQPCAPRHWLGLGKQYVSLRLIIEYKLGNLEKVRQREDARTPNRDTHLAVRIPDENLAII